MPGSIAYVPYVANVCNRGYIAEVIYVDLVVDIYSPEPLYSQVAAILRGRIESGELAHLDPLPSEKTVEQDLGVSRDTVRRAIKLLRDEGIVFTVPQRGTYVGPRP
jgi:GntR family transcriptional regulator